jgi:SAM-dependent methyltransferase
MTDPSHSASDGLSRSMCPLCGGKASWPLSCYREPSVERQLSASGRNRDYQWFLCQTCGNGYPTFVPELSVLSALWASNRDIAEGDRAREEQIWKERRRISRIGAERSFKIFSPLRKGARGRFLDIACGLGATVRKFADQGWDAYGVDADPTMRRFHEEFGIRSEIAQIETIKLDGKFDLIQVAHAIYFISDPMRFLRTLKDALGEDGLLCIVLADFMAAEDLSLPGYPHSFFPTAASMNYLLAIAGYRSVLYQALSGSIYLVARVGESALPPVNSRLIRFGYQTKKLRYALLGRPKLWLRSVVKYLLYSARRWDQ